MPGKNWMKLSKAAVVAFVVWFINNDRSDALERALTTLDRLLQPRHQLGAEDVDLPMEEAALVRQLVFLLLQVRDQAAELVVGEGCKVRKWFHASAFRPLSGSVQ